MPRDTTGIEWCLKESYQTFMGKGCTKYRMLLELKEQSGQISREEKKISRAKRDKQKFSPVLKAFALPDFRRPWNLLLLSNIRSWPPWRREKGTKKKTLLLYRFYVQREFYIKNNTAPHCSTFLKGTKKQTVTHGRSHTCSFHCEYCTAKVEKNLCKNTRGW